MASLRHTWTTGIHLHPVIVILAALIRVLTTPELFAQSGDSCWDPHGLGVSDEALSLHHAAPR